MATDNTKQEEQHELEVLAEGVNNTELVTGCCTGGASTARS